MVKVTERFVTLFDDDWECAHYQGVILRSIKNKVFVLSVGHDMEVGQTVKGYFNNRKIRGKVISYIYDGKGRDTSIIKFIIKNLKKRFPNLPITNPPHDRRFNVEIIYADYNTHGFDALGALIDKREVHLTARAVKFPKADINCLEIKAGKSNIDCDGVCGAPVMWNNKLVGIMNEASLEAREGFAVSGCFLRSFTGKKELFK